MTVSQLVKLNIIIVDDHLVFREGLRTIISQENIANVVAEASNGLEFLDLLATQNPDLVLMDIDMPTMNGLEAAEKALKIMPDLKILIYTMFGDEEYYKKMVELGVAGYILKSSNINELENAIQTIMSVGKYFPPT